MNTAKIRKIVTTVENTHLEMGQSIEPPTRRAASVAVIENPFAGKYEENLEALMIIGEELGDLLGRKCVEALGIQPSQGHTASAHGQTIALCCGKGCCTGGFK